MADFPDSYTGFNKGIQITGLAFYDLVQDTVPAGTEKVLVSLSGPGMIYVAFVLITATESARDCEVFFSFDGNQREYNQIGFLYDNGALAGIVPGGGVSVFDEVNYRYAIYLEERITFNKSFEAGVKNPLSSDVSVIAKVGYTTFS